METTKAYHETKAKAGKALIQLRGLLGGMAQKYGDEESMILEARNALSLLSDGLSNLFGSMAADDRTGRLHFLEGKDDAPMEIPPPPAGPESDSDQLDFAPTDETQAQNAPPEF